MGEGGRGIPEGDLDNYHFVTGVVHWSDALEHEAGWVLANHQAVCSRAH